MTVTRAFANVLTDDLAGTRNLFYGQRQLLLTDPNGTLVDASTPIAPSEEFTASLVQDGATMRQRNR